MTIPETSLTWLGRLIESPDGADWQRLSDLYAPLLRNWAVRAGVPVSDVDDVTQDVLIVVINQVAEFDHRGPGAFRGWLRAILVNQLKAYFRRNSDQSCRLPLDLICDSESNDSKAFDREHDEYLVARAMQLIRHEYESRTWEAFRLQIVDGHRPVHVSEQLGMSANAAVKAKIRVLRRLREVLSEMIK